MKTYFQQYIIQPGCSYRKPIFGTPSLPKQETYSPAETLSFACLCHGSRLNHAPSVERIVNDILLTSDLLCAFEDKILNFELFDIKSMLAKECCKL